MRYFTFKPDENKIYAYTYSPTRNGGLGEFETDATNLFTLDYDMESGGEFEVIATNVGVASSSNTSAVWQDLSPGPNTSGMSRYMTAPRPHQGLFGR